MAKRKQVKRTTKRTTTKTVAAPKKHPFWPYGIVIFAFLLGADRFTKHVILQLLAQGESLRIFSWLDFTYVQNTGTLWGSLNGSGMNWAFIWLSIIAFGLLIFYHDRFTTWIEKLSLAMLFAGLWGNLIDRGTYGFVIDFIDLGGWPVFNIADACIVAGVLLFLLETWRLEREKKATIAKN
jgi:signal peptidase II